MKLSEAILLGSTVVTPKARALHFSGENAGCALGMAAIASGCTFSPAPREIPVKDKRTGNVEDIWGPWLLRVVVRPCDCRAPVRLSKLHFKEIPAYLFYRSSSTLPRGMRIKDIIAHLFDHHVMGERDWTLDELVAWLERWEPKEPARNTFHAGLGRMPHYLRESHCPSEEVAEWQRTRAAFEAKINPPRRSGPSAR